MPDEAPPRRTAVDAARSWLGNSGYPLEMRTARAFKAVGANPVEQSRQYPVEDGQGGSREIDVLAVCHTTRSISARGNGWVELRAVVECKDSGAPWVLFIGDERLRTGDHLDALEIRRYRGAGAPTDIPREAPLLHDNRRVAYKVRTAGDNDKPSYDAIRQAMSAVTGHVNDLVPESDESTPPGIVIFLPVVVTSASLVECSLGEDGEPDFREVDRGLLVGRLTSQERRHLVWIVNSRAVDAFAEDCWRTGASVQFNVG